MSVWWLAVDKKNASYEELKHRKVVAQGWSAIEDLRTLCTLAKNGDGEAEEAFKKTVDELERIVYEGNKTGIPAKVMWSLMRLKEGDLIVAIEGTVVRGICRLDKNGWESYQYDCRDEYEYAHTIGFPVRWKDWDIQKLGNPPIAPAQSVQGIAKLEKESQKVVDAWDKIK